MPMQIRRTSTPNNPPTDLAPGQLSVEMASNPPKLWVGVPTDIDPTGRRPLAPIEISGGTGEFLTGDVKLTYKLEADPGFIMCNDQGIGNAESGAHHAGPQFEALFELLFNLPNNADTYAPLYLSNGTLSARSSFGSAAVAWAYNCRIQLTRMLGRALAGSGTGAGLTARFLGQWTGAESPALSINETPNHLHRIYGENYTTPSDASNPWGYTYPENYAIISIAATTGDGGGGAPHSNYQPTAWLNAMICL